MVIFYFLLIDLFSAKLFFFSSHVVYVSSHFLYFCVLNFLYLQYFIVVLFLLVVLCLLPLSLLFRFSISFVCDNRIIFVLLNCLFLPFLETFHFCILSLFEYTFLFSFFIFYFTEQSTQTHLQAYTYTLLEKD